MTARRMAAGKAERQVMPEDKARILLLFSVVRAGHAKARDSAHVAKIEIYH
jgi:hypothetical protein